MQAISKRKRTAKRMRRRLSALLSLLLLLQLCACSDVPRITDEAAMPLQHAIDGVVNADLRTYLSAFPDDYVAAITEEYERSVCPDFTAYMEEFLGSALDVHRANLGDGVELWFVVESKTELTESEWRDCFEGYVDYNVIQYHPDESKTTEAFKITGTLHSRGGDNETESQGNFIVLHYDGKWVLHPVNFFNTFN